MDVIAMMRPNRLRIINLVAARARRKVAVKLTLMTSSQSSSRNCTNRLSRVMPALATRISTWPMAFSAEGTSASTSAASERLQGSTKTLSPNLPASASSTSRRVPEIAPVAPCACSAWAIAPPMPPVAPVTSAFLPVRSNINISLTTLGRMRSRHGVLCGANIAGAADWNANRTLSDALDQTAQHLAGADFEKPDDTVACHVSHRLAPTHGSRNLLDQAAADFVRLADRRGQYVRDQRRSRLLDRDTRERFCHHVGCGLHQGAVKRRRDRQQHGALGAPGFGDLERALDSGLVAGDHDLAAAIVIGGLADLTLRGLVRDRHRGLIFQTEQSRHCAGAHWHRLLHGKAARAQQARGIADAEAAGSGERGIFAEP